MGLPGVAQLTQGEEEGEDRSERSVASCSSRKGCAAAMRSSDHALSTEKSTDLFPGALMVCETTEFGSMAGPGMAYPKAVRNAKLRLFRARRKAN